MAQSPRPMAQSIVVVEKAIEEAELMVNATEVALEASQVNTASTLPCVGELMRSYVSRNSEMDLLSGMLRIGID